MWTLLTASEDVLQVSGPKLKDQPPLPGKMVFVIVPAPKGHTQSGEGQDQPGHLTNPGQLGVVWMEARSPSLTLTHEALFRACKVEVEQ